MITKLDRTVAKDLNVWHILHDSSVMKYVVILVKISGKTPLCIIEEILVVRKYNKVLFPTCLGKFDF